MEYAWGVCEFKVCILVSLYASSAIFCFLSESLLYYPPRIDLHNAATRHIPYENFPKGAVINNHVGYEIAMMTLQEKASISRVAGLGLQAMGSRGRRGTSIE